MGLISFVCIAQPMETQYLNRKYQLTKKNRACFVRKIQKVNDTLFTVTDFTKNEKIVMNGSYSLIKPMIENGEFQFFDKKSNILASGHYRNGIMCGEWTFLKAQKYSRL